MNTEAIEKYIKHTPSVVSGPPKLWIDAALDRLGAQAHILEVGSGTGRDADYIESRGYRVERTDNNPLFIEHQKKSGVDISSFDVLKDKKKETYDLIFVNAVFHHFTTQQFKTVLSKLKKNVANGGLLAFSLPQKTDESEVYDALKHDTYFQYWQEEEPRHFLTENEFKEIYFDVSKETGWIYVVAKLV